MDNLIEFKETIIEIQFPSYRLRIFQSQLPHSVVIGNFPELLILFLYFSCMR